LPATTGVLPSRTRNEAKEVALMGRAAWCVALLAGGLVAGCQKSDDGGAGAGGSGGAAADGAVSGGQDAAPGDAAPVAPDAAPDAAPADGAPDAAPADPCAAACERVVSCTNEVCMAPVDGLAAACATACAGNAAFGTVVGGADDCATVVDFGRTVFDDAYRAACDMTPPDEGGDDPATCRFPCGEGETCRDTHCVRADHTCVTDYHCVLGQETCAAGHCVPAQFATCRTADDCSAGQICKSFDQNPLGTGNCFVPCQTDDVCPTNEVCNHDYGDICYFALCGATNRNGEEYGGCGFGTAAGPGTCYPLAQASQPPGGGGGVCIEAGTAARGAGCDSQSTGRDADAKALACGPGLLCWGDFDDPENPTQPPMMRGTCAGLCDPRHAACQEGEFCLDFTTPDDPSTPADETTPVGLCLPTDCDVIDGGCMDGSGCRPLVLTAHQGQCFPDGPAGALAPCQTSDDCAGGGICGDGPMGTKICYLPCNPADSACPEGMVCYTQEGWAMGLCAMAPAQ
jgi:hypothetical protein